MLKKFARYVVTGKEEDTRSRMTVECLETEDPIVKACRMSPEIRKSNVITVELIGVVTRDVEIYPQKVREEIPKDMRPKTDTIWSYVDARNRWSDEH